MHGGGESIILHVQITNKGLGHSRVNSEVSEKCFYSNVLSSVPQSLIDLFAARISLVIISQNQAFTNQRGLCRYSLLNRMLKIKS